MNRGMPGHRGAAMIRKGRPKISKGVFKKLIKYIFSNYKYQFLFVFICILISSIAGVVSSLFIKVLIDDYITPVLLKKPPITSLIKIITIMALVYLIGLIASFIYNRMMVNISQGSLKNIRNQMFKHMQTLPINYFDTNTHGDIMSHYTNDADALRQMISQSIPSLFSSIITITAVFSMMLYMSFWLTIVVMIGILIMLKVTSTIGKRASGHFIKQQQSLANINGYIEEMVEGQKVIKVFTHEDKTKIKFDQINEELCTNATKANQYANILMPVMGNISNTIYVAVAIIGGLLAINGVGAITLGIIGSFLQLTKSFAGPISQISQQLNSVIMALAGAERIFKLLDEKSEIDEGNVTLVDIENLNGKIKESDCYTGKWAWKHPLQDGTVEYIELKGDVRFFDVTFGYEPSKVVLDNISLYAKPGQKIAFVGATGAGKTTITNLINRFYEIEIGKIDYDGIDIKKIKKADLRKSLGIVLQETNLFTGTIMENIKFGKKDASDEECIEAAKLANADHFIRMLPEGYNTVIIGNGSSLSQGQRQLLSITRATVANPPVMILDEATSSIDTRTEKFIQQGMDLLMKDRTVFVIAHRLSTVHDAKAIIVLESGKIIERGNHDQLIKEKGKYYQLYTGSFELE